MKRMIAITIRPGSTTAAARLIVPGKACPIMPPPADTRTRKNVPSSSEKRRRRLGCHAGYMIDRHSLADALEFRLALCHGVWCNNFRYSRRAVNFFGDTNLVAIGKVLHPRCDIHRLAKIIEPLVECDRDRGSPMHADL